MKETDKNKLSDDAQTADEYWERFMESGRISSYLQYKTHTNASKKDGETGAYR